MSKPALVLAISLAACAVGRRSPAQDHQPDAGVSQPRADASPAASDASPAGPDAAPASDLDPGLALPDPGGATCAQPGSLGECGLAEVCRFFDSTSGRCESCVDCGNLGAACTASADCDILFSCYQGACTNFCTLGSSECGAPADCVDIGHPTRGVCRP